MGVGAVEVVAGGDSSSDTVGTVAGATGGAVRVRVGAVSSAQPSRTEAAATMKMIGLMPATFGPGWNRSVMRHRKNLQKETEKTEEEGLKLRLNAWGNKSRPVTSDRPAL
jgi:hypothetical protein